MCRQAVSISGARLLLRCRYELAPTVMSSMEMKELSSELLWSVGGVGPPREFPYDKVKGTSRRSGEDASHKG